MRTRAVPIVLTLALLAGGGCSSSGTPGGALPSAATPAQHRRTTTRLTIHIPRRVRRKARYVSPATQSMSYSIVPAGKCATCSGPVSGDVGLTPASPNCVPANNGLACTIELALAPGNYVGSISTYDGPVGCQATGACNTLSADQSFPVTIVAGKANTPSIALYGVPKYLVVYPASSNASVLQTEPIDEAYIYVAGLNATATVALYALDADENLILGPGSPAFSLPSTPSLNWTAAVKGSLLTLTTGSVFKPALGFSALPIDLVSPSCAIAGAECSLGVELWIDPLLATVDTTNGAVHVYSTDFSQSKLVDYATVTNGVAGPSDVKFDDANGNLFVANVASVTVYAPPYTGAPIATIPAAPIATHIAVDEAGDVAVASSFISPAVYVYSAPGYALTATIPLSYSASAITFAYPFSSNLWIAQRGSVASYASPYNGSANPNLSIGNPAGLDVDAEANVDVADSVAGTLTQYVASNGYAAGTSHGSLDDPTAVSASGLLTVCVAGAADEYLYAGQLVDAIGTESSTPCLLASDDINDTFVASAPAGSATLFQAYDFYFGQVPYATGAIAVFPSARASF